MSVLGKSGLVTLALTLAACATTAPPAAPPAQEDSFPARPPKGTCDASLVQSYVGQKATTESGNAILTASTAKRLRWGPPNSAWTMDYREDRVNVRYDADMIITAITCG